jgi:hypothetical protein
MHLLPVGGDDDFRLEQFHRQPISEPNFQILQHSK